MPRSLSSPLVQSIESFLRAQHDAKPRTMLDYEGALRRFDAFMGSKYERTPDPSGHPRGKLRLVEVVATLGDLTADNVNRYISRKRVNRYRGRGDAAVLKVFSKWLVKARILASDPLVGVNTPSIPKHGRDPLPDTIVPAVVKAAEESQFPIRDRAIVLLYLDAGLRPNELRQLRWPDDLDLERGEIHVREDITKTAAGKRTIPLDHRTIRALDEYVNDDRGRHAGPLFTNRHRDQFTYYGLSSLCQRLKVRLERQGITGFVAYRLRHTALTNKHRAGWQFPDLKYVAGHATDKSTLRYVKPRNPDELRRLPSGLSVYGKAV